MEVKKRLVFLSALSLSNEWGLRFHMYPGGGGGGGDGGGGS